MTAGTSRWYWINNGTTAGPITWGELQLLAQRGQLRANDLVLREGRQNWQPARTARDVDDEQVALPTISAPAAPLTAVASAPPPPPPARPSVPAAPFADHDLGERSFSARRGLAVNAGRLLGGILLCGGGIVGTILGHNAAVAHGGGRYVIFTGPIIWGFVLIVQSFSGNNGASDY
jgi:hypothetical protein